MHTVSKPYRAALFVDFENLYQTLKDQTRQGRGDYGESPRIDFEYLADQVRQQYGTLEPDDFIAAGNFSHYNQQLGGLNRVATIINTDSFLPRPVRNEDQKSSGKRYVIHNYADMVLAFEAGRHLETNPADIYLFVAGDGAFSAVGKMIQEQYSKPVEFILPNYNRGRVLKALFTCHRFSDFQPPVNLQKPETLIATPEEETTTPVDEITEWVRQLRRELSTAIPAGLVWAMLGPSTAQPLLDRARTEMKIDLWEGEGGEKFISLREERMAGKIVRMNTRAGVQTAARLLFLVAQKSELSHLPISRPQWRRFLKEQANLTNAEVKGWIEVLFDARILKDGTVGPLELTLSGVIEFVQAVESRLQKNT